MQYPIIDLITDAYLNNGWTGLDVESNNIANPIYGNSSPFVMRGVQFIRNNNIIQVNGTATGGPAYFNITFVVDVSSALPALNYIGKYVRVISNFPDSLGLGFFRNNGTFFSINNNTIIPNEAAAFRFFISVSENNTINGTYTYMIVVSDNPIPEDLPYEPYVPPTTDIAHRLKLPLPHYFPHPVIDALQRAAAGTQTADDTEILRHYLTPLGIGGI